MKSKTNRTKELINLYKEIEIKFTEIQVTDIITIARDKSFGKYITEEILYPLYITSIKYTFLHNHMTKIIGINLTNNNIEEFNIDYNREQKTKILRIR